jgi:hypothetical protein
MLFVILGSFALRAHAAATTAVFASATALTGDAVVVPGSVIKSPRNPLFVQDEPWERRIDNGYANVVEDESTGALRLWYGVCLGAESNASACSLQGFAYAESTDGLAFVKPTLNLFNLSAFEQLPPFLKSLGTRNNLLLVGGGIGVARDRSVAVGTPGAFRAFGVGCFEPGGGAATGGKGSSCVSGTGESADGLTWTGAASVAWPPPQRYDCQNNLYWDDVYGHWVLTTRSYDASPEGAGREISVIQSAGVSFGGWPAAVPVVAHGNASEQLYSMATFRWLDVRLGIVMVFDATKPTTEGRVHCRLLFQAHRSANASAPFDFVGGPAGAAADFIPLGADGEFDSHICFAAAHPLPGASVGEQTRLYYFGGDGPHNGARNTSLGLALLRADGFASVVAEKRGTAVIADVKVTAALLTATVDIIGPGGSVRLGARGVPGLSLADCTPLTVTATDAEVVFAGGRDFSSLVGEVVDFEVELEAGAIFTIGFAG